jgi:hypothetical protein
LVPKVANELIHGLFEEWLKSVVLFDNSCHEIESTSSIEWELHQMSEIDEQCLLFLLNEFSSLDLVVPHGLSFLEMFLGSFHISMIVRVFLVELETKEKQV